MSLGSGVLQQVQSLEALVSAVHLADGVKKRGHPLRVLALPVAPGSSATKRERQQLPLASCAVLEHISQFWELQRRLSVSHALLATSAALRASQPVTSAKQVLMVTPLAGRSALVAPKVRGLQGLVQSVLICVPAGSSGQNWEVS